MEDAQSKVIQVQTRISDVEAVKVRKERTMDEADDRMSRLKALIAQARHKSDTVGYTLLGALFLW